jgi:hypothetical protein
LLQSVSPGVLLAAAAIILLCCSSAAAVYFGRRRKYTELVDPEGPKGGIPVKDSLETVNIEMSWIRDETVLPAKLEKDPLNSSSLVSQNNPR